MERFLSRKKDGKQKVKKESSDHSREDQAFIEDALKAIGVKIKTVEQAQRREEREILFAQIRHRMANIIYGKSLAVVFSVLMSPGTETTPLPSKGDPEATQHYSRAWERAAALPVVDRSGAESLPSPEEMYRYLREQYGEAELRRLLPPPELDRRALQERRQREQEEPRVEVEGAELIGMRSEDLQRYVVEGFPRGLTGRTSVYRIRITNERIPMEKEVAVSKYQGGHCTIAPGSASSEIVLTLDGMSGNTNGERVRSLLTYVLPHELIHSGDQRNASSMDPQAQLEVLYISTYAVQSQQALKFDYVEGIRSVDPRHRLALRAQEYIAEVGRARFGYRLSQMPQLNNEVARRELAVRMAADYHTTPDVAMRSMYMIDRVVGPSFDWEASARVREEIQDRVSLEQDFILPITRALEHIPDPEMRAALLRVFQASRSNVSDIYTATVVPEDELGTRMDAIVGETQEQMDRRVEREIPVLRHVKAFQRSEVDRLVASVPAEARPMMEQWMRLVDAVVRARETRWVDRPSSESRARASGGVMEEGSELSYRLRTESAYLALPAVRQAMLEYVRVVGYAELRLPEPLASQAREFHRTRI